MARGKGRSRARKPPMAKAMPMDAAPMKPPSMKDRMGDYASSAARSVMEEHPLHQQMKKDMTNALMSIAKGNSGSARGRSAGPMKRSVFS